MRVWFRHIKIFSFLFLIVSFSSGVVLAEKTDPRLEEAKKFFSRYVALELTYDPASADLYDDHAVIRNTRRYPDGKVRVVTIEPTQFKSLIVSTIPLARSRGDKNTYSKMSYIVEGDRVRIRCTRYSELKKYSSPMELIVGPDASGTWKIFQELTESRP